MNLLHSQNGSTSMNSIRILKSKAIFINPAIIVFINFNIRQMKKNIFFIAVIYFGLCNDTTAQSGTINLQTACPTNSCPGTIVHANGVSTTITSNFGTGVGAAQNQTNMLGTTSGTVPFTFNVSSSAGVGTPGLGIIHNYTTPGTNPSTGNLYTIEFNNLLSGLTFPIYDITSPSISCTQLVSTAATYNDMVTITGIDAMGNEVNATISELARGSYNNGSYDPTDNPSYIINDLYSISGNSAFVQGGHISTTGNTTQTTNAGSNVPGLDITVSFSVPVIKVKILYKNDTGGLYGKYKSTSTATCPATVGSLPSGDLAAQGILIGNLSYSNIIIENCANGLDDDNDGLTDCADSECVFNSACLTPYVCPASSSYEDIDWSTTSCATAALTSANIQTLNNNTGNIFIEKCDATSKPLEAKFNVQVLDPTEVIGGLANVAFLAGQNAVAGTQITQGSSTASRDNKLCYNSTVPIPWMLMNSGGIETFFNTVVKFEAFDANGARVVMKGVLQATTASAGSLGATLNGVAPQSVLNPAIVNDTILTIKGFNTNNGALNYTVESFQPITKFCVSWRSLNGDLISYKISTCSRTCPPLFCSDYPQCEAPMITNVNVVNANCLTCPQRNFNGSVTVTASTEDTVNDLPAIFSYKLTSNPGNITQYSSVNGSFPIVVPGSYWAVVTNTTTGCKDSVSVAVQDPLCDNDNDGIFDNVDIDNDNDGVLDIVESPPYIASFTSFPNNGQAGSGSMSNGCKTINFSTTMTGGVTIDNTATSTGTSVCTFNNTNYVPALPISDAIGISMAGAANAQAGTITFTFSEPITNPLIYFSNNDHKYWDFAPTAGLTSITRLSGNTSFLVDGTKLGRLDQTTTTTNNNFLGCTAQAGGAGLPGRGVAQLNGTFTSITANIIGLNGALDITSVTIGSFEPCDTDGDNIPNTCDLDSDGDSCPDAVEAGLTSNLTTATFAGPYGDNGLANSIETNDLPTATIANAPNYSSSNYQLFSLNSNFNLCQEDCDGDGVTNTFDIDDDNDGVLDVSEGATTLNYINPNFTGNTNGWTLGAGFLYSNYSGGGLFVAAECVTGSTTTFQTLTCPMGTFDMFTFSIGWNNGIGGNCLSSPTNKDIDIIIGGVRYAFIRTPADGSSNIDNATLQGGDMIITALNGATINAGLSTLAINHSPFNNWALTNVTLNLPDHIRQGSISFVATSSGSDDVFIDNVNIVGSCPNDTDNDGIANLCDLDSDGDGCADAIEAGALPFNSMDSLFHGAVNAQGLPLSVPSYTSTYSNYALDSLLNFCDDCDGNGISNFVDIDDDNDGVLDNIECPGLLPYKVFTHNRVATGFPTNLPITITGNSVINTTLNQTLAQNDLTYNGVGWKELASNVQPDASNNIVVSMVPTTSTTGSFIIADAMLVTNGIDTIIIDNSSSSGYTKTGTWIAQNIAGAYLGNNDYSQPVYTGKTATWTFSNLSNINDCDPDMDGIINTCDLDSDGDGCSDAIEAGNAPLNDAIYADTMTYPSLPPSTTSSTTYAQYALNTNLNFCDDCDMDGISNYIDIDDDNDGVLDVNELFDTIYLQNFSGFATGPGVLPTTQANPANFWVSNNQTIQINNADAALGKAPIVWMTYNSTNPPNPFLTTDPIIVVPGKEYEFSYGSKATQTGNIPIFSVDVTYNGGSTWTNIIPPYTVQAAYLIRDITLVPPPGATSMQVRFNNSTIGSTGNDGGIDDLLLTTYSDTDNDGFPNTCDLDSDGDGCSDAFEAGATTNPTPNFTFPANTVGANGLAAAVENNDSPTATITYTSTYVTNALNPLIKSCCGTFNAGTDKVVCQNASTTMTATMGLGTWMWTPLATNPGTATITSPASATTTINMFSVAGVYNFKWSNGSCMDTVKVTVNGFTSYDSCYRSDCMCNVKHNRHHLCEYTNSNIQLDKQQYGHRSRCKWYRQYSKLYGKQ